MQFAVLPAERGDAEPEDITGTINVAPTATIPIEIGETSSIELPVITPEERPPVVKPGQVKSKIEIKKKIVRRVRSARPPAKPKVAKPKVARSQAARSKSAKPEPAPANIIEAIFGATPSRQASSAAPQANQPVPAR